MCVCVFCFFEMLGSKYGQSISRSVYISFSFTSVVDEQHRVQSEWSPTPDLNAVSAFITWQTCALPIDDESKVGVDVSVVITITLKIWPMRQSIRWGLIALFELFICKLWDWVSELYPMTFSSPHLHDYSIGSEFTMTVMSTNNSWMTRIYSTHVLADTDILLNNLVANCLINQNASVDVVSHSKLPHEVSCPA